MRKLLLVLLAMLSVSLLSAQTVGDERAISVREAQLRTAPVFLSGVVARLPYGVLVEIAEVGEGWFLVRAVESGDEGWITASAVEPPESLNLGAGDGDRGNTTTREIALAGRGFNEQIESEYKDENDLDFSLVDQMEQFVLPPEQLAEFLAAIEADLTLGVAQ
jgi:hypothetical protein